MDKFVVKNIIVFSLVLGAILGLLAPIPYVGTVMLVIALVLSAPIIMFYMIMDSKLELTTTKDSIIRDFESLGITIVSASVSLLIINGIIIIARSIIIFFIVSPI